ncbi:MAG: hypothetical protein A2268_05640 [Candidatus Raymondbacteria bacterium RifOxyA12_full_50_37]|nr:MAG: hypothetical protein A2268_05640 [Candidatus Raymondbacteria bacterium RifOxyA12_full_50_37]
MRTLYSFFCMLALAVALFGQTAKLPVAVSELEGRGLGAGEAGTLTDALRSYLINTGSFRVMERGKMDEVLKEQGFQSSGACTDQACLVEMGQLLGVEYMITGSIGKVGGTYSVNVRMISIRTGEINRTVNKFYKGEIDGLLTQIIPTVADEFAREGGSQSASLNQAVVQQPASQPQPKPVQEKAPEVVKEKKSGGSAIPWIVGGVVLAGAGVAAYYFLVAKPAQDEEIPGTVEVTW